VRAGRAGGGPRGAPRRRGPGAAGPWNPDSHDESPAASRSPPGRGTWPGVRGRGPRHARPPPGTGAEMRGCSGRRGPPPGRTSRAHTTAVDSVCPDPRCSAETASRARWTGVPGQAARVCCPVAAAPGPCCRPRWRAPPRRRAAPADARRQSSGASPQRWMRGRLAVRVAPQACSRSGAFRAGRVRPAFHLMHTAAADPPTPQT